MPGGISASPIQTRTAPKYGEHSREILKELDYTDLEIKDLVERSIVAEKWSDEYLPD